MPILGDTDRGYVSEIGNGSICTDNDTAVITVPTSGWTSHNTTYGTYKLTLTSSSTFVSGNFDNLLSTDHPILDLSASSTQLSDIDALNEAWSKVYAAECGNGTITLYASAIPSTAFNMSARW